MPKKQLTDSQALAVVNKYFPKGQLASARITREIGRPQEEDGLVLTFAGDNILVEGNSEARKHEEWPLSLHGKIRRVYAEIRYQEGEAKSVADAEEYVSRNVWVNLCFSKRQVQLCIHGGP